MTTLSSIDDFAQHFDFVFANSDELKRECYQLRYAIANPTAGSGSARGSMDIDQYDAHSLHVLLRQRSSRKCIATARVIRNDDRLRQRLLPFERASRETIFVKTQSLTSLQRSSFSEISGVSVKEENPTPFSANKIITGLFLSAIALARLEFQQYTFARLTSAQFKHLRAQGLNFEHAHPFHAKSQQALEALGLYYLDAEAGVSTSSPIYSLWQHILNELAHQLHLPQVSEGDSGSFRTA